jgi:hypothetical protein
MAESWRAEALRFFADVRACRDRALREAALCPSFLRAALVARERFADGF